VKTKADSAECEFPVLIDGTKANWNAWGNSMWPSVYLVDKRGYLRHFWPGELKWRGATGDQWMRERIEELLAEPAAASSNDSYGSRMSLARRKVTVIFTTLYDQWGPPPISNMPPPAAAAPTYPDESFMSVVGVGSTLTISSGIKRMFSLS